MFWTELHLNTPIPQIPRIINTNLHSFERYINLFYDGSLGILTVPLETTGRIKGTKGEFVTAVVDNLIVKRQFTNLYDNNTVADYNFYKMYIEPPVVLRDPCTDSNYWPKEYDSFKYIDVQRPYYKVTGDTSVALYNNNLSQIVGIYFDTSVSTSASILIDPCTMSTYDGVSGMYVEFIAVKYDPSWGSTWEKYKSGGGVGTIIDDNFVVNGDTTLVGDVSIFGVLYVDGSIILNGVEITPGGGSGIYNPPLSDDIKMPDAVGGLPAETSVGYLRGKTFEEIFTEILFPTAYPVLTAPSLLSFVLTPTTGLTTFQEIGATIDISTYTSFSRGSINPQYSALSSFRSGPVNTYFYTGFGLPASQASTSNNDSQLILGYTVVQGNQTAWSCNAAFDIGVQPYDSKGNIYDSPYPAGNSNTLNRTFEGVYPLFATTSVISNPDTKQTLVSMISGQYAPSSSGFNLVAESGGFKQSFDIPIAWTSLRPIINIQTYAPAFGTWSDSGFGEWTTSTVFHTIQGNSIQYTRYTFNGAERAATSVRLRFS